MRASSRAAARTNVLLQAYVSPELFDEAQTSLDELTATKYQLSLALRQRSGPHVFTLAITENLQNLNNTPDIGLQLGWLNVPTWEPPAGGARSPPANDCCWNCGTVTYRDGNSHGTNSLKNQDAAH